jgi:hypothetical protein
MLKNIIAMVVPYAYWAMGLVYLVRAAIHVDAADIAMSIIYGTMAYTLKNHGHGTDRSAKKPQASDQARSDPEG